MTEYSKKSKELTKQIASDVKKKKGIYFIVQGKCDGTRILHSVIKNPSPDH